MALCFPVLLVYELGMLVARLPERNGVDWITAPLLHWLGPERLGLGLLVAFALLVAIQRLGNQPYLRTLLFIVLESAVYALAMGLVIATFMKRVLGIDPTLAVPAGMPTGLGGLVLACGAGIYEEAAFRWIGIGLLRFFGTRLGLARGLALAVALVLSAVLFALAHHIGPTSDPLRPGVFTYRVLAGIVFGALFLWRGFPVAVYTHTLYDLYVMVVR